MEKSKFFERVGWVGMVTSILMYVFYFRVIQQNLSGHPGDPLQPLMAGINCTLWVCYGLFKEKRDWPITIANAPGVIFGFIAAYTSF
nr:SemiSWEET family transporter [Hoylesella enoeca]